jgi:oligoribonuclease (3'-5' exoribonuclease)
MQYPDIMVDLETTGTQPETTNIIQIAAVRFNLAEGTVGPDFFDRCLMPTTTRFWDEDTRIWWNKMPELLASIKGRGEEPRKVLQAFSQWAGSGARMWAKPISFEFPFLSSYFREFEVMNPFNFREAMDVNTFLRARHFPELAPKYEREIEFVGTVHNAIDDVLHQIKTVGACYAATR